MFTGVLWYETAVYLHTYVIIGVISGNMTGNGQRGNMTDNGIFAGTLVVMVSQTSRAEYHVTRCKH